MVLQAGARAKRGITGVGLQIFQGSASARHRALHKEERQHWLSQHLQTPLHTQNHPARGEATGFGGKEGKKLHHTEGICNWDSCTHGPRQGACPSGTRAGLLLGKSSPTAAQPRQKPREWQWCARGCSFWGITPAPMGSSGVPGSFTRVPPARAPQGKQVHWAREVSRWEGCFLPEPHLLPNCGSETPGAKEVTGVPGTAGKWSTGENFVDFHSHEKHLPSSGTYREAPERKTPRHAFYSLPQFPLLYQRDAILVAQPGDQTAEVIGGGHHVIYPCPWGTPGTPRCSVSMWAHPPAAQGTGMSHYLRNQGPG